MSELDDAMIAAGIKPAQTVEPSGAYDELMKLSPPPALIEALPIIIVLAVILFIVWIKVFFEIDRARFNETKYRATFNVTKSWPKQIISDWQSIEHNQNYPKINQSNLNKQIEEWEVYCSKCWHPLKPLIWAITSPQYADSLGIRFLYFGISIVISTILLSVIQTPWALVAATIGLVATCSNLFPKHYPRLIRIFFGFVVICILAFILASIFWY